MQREHTFTVDGLTKQGGRWAYKWGGGALISGWAYVLNNIHVMV